MADDKKFDLSRRKVLGSIGTIGVASAAAGAGTMALFHDDENINGNEVKAGTLDLVVHSSYDAHQGSIEGTSKSSDNYGGEANVSYSVDDIKPGDTGNFTFCAKPKSNPAWVWMRGNITADHDGKDTEPEMDVDPNATEDGTDTTNGELDEEMLATLKYDSGETIIPEDTLRNVISDLNGAMRLDNSPGDGSMDYIPANNEQCVVLEWRVPESVENVIQGDVLKFDFGFYAEQYRHNQTPSNPYDPSSGQWNSSTNVN